MASRKKPTKTIEQNAKSPKVAGTAKSVEIFAGGIRTDKDFADGMSALMSDVITGAVTPAVANAACKAGGNLLKIIELKYRYGSERNRNGLILASGI